MKNPLTATSVSVHVCEHGTVYLRLHDADRQIFAIACMDASVAVNIMEDLTEQLEAVKRGDNIGAYNSHA